jgi:hypothetical protein
LASQKKSSRHKKQHPATTAPKKAEAAVTDKRAKQKETTRKKNIYSRPLLPGRWYINTLIFLLLIVFTLLIYSGDLHLGFFRIDDQQYVVKNPWIRSFSSENIRHILTTPYFVNYSPLHLFSYMVDYSFSGENGYVFHLSSNLWAGLTAAFVFLVALAITGRQIIAVAAAILFVVHPSHVEAVAWIASRKDLVAAAFALPSLLAYLYYRRGGRSATRWYILSLLLFFLALCGKLSVATFPAVLLAFDLFVEKRPLMRSLVDKIPFLIAAIIIAIIVASAQPPTGSHPDPYVLSAALVQNFWLLTGFGNYVIYRVAPTPGAMAIEIAAVLFLIAAFVVPFLLRRRLPMAMVLIYWILFAFIPTQILSFAYPVTDRYQFFPSVAAVILIAWGLITAGERLGRRGLFISIPLLVIIAFTWARATLNYLAEWRDPRSVWYAATFKSSDPQVYYNLGWHYMNAAAQLGTATRKAPLTIEEKKQLASAVWEHDPQLPALLAEWNSGQKDGALEKSFQSQLRKLALRSLDQALQKKGNHIMPDLYFHRGLLFLDSGNLSEARKEFLDAIDEASRSTFTEGRQETLVNSHYNLGVLTWGQANYEEALTWIKLAEEEQIRFGGNWVKDITESRKRLEGIIAIIKARK